MEWFVGFHSHPDERPCLLLIAPERKAFLMPALNAEGSRAFTYAQFFDWSDDQGRTDALADALNVISAPARGRAALDETMRADFALLLLKVLPADTLQDFMPPTLDGLRMKKDEAEFYKLKMNAAIAAFATIRPGMAERQVAAEIRTAFLSEGAVPAFWIVGAGPNGAFPHHSAIDRTIEEGDTIVIDIGGRKSGFPSDVTRMTVIACYPRDVTKFTRSSKGPSRPR
ncbi:M24 family metallopeptidase [Rhizobium mesoamericanum]|uniref:Putative dipeptidase PepE n=1 Tax=Rhizobium mesoamericanum STM3625 TaxID=1211777 RepID=K0Q5L7_9HYPH